MTGTNERFSARDWAFLSQVPRVVGLWMLHQDNGGGARAQRLGAIALQAALVRLREKYSGVALVRDLLSAEAEATEDPQWANALQDCRAALQLLQGHADPLSLNCFRLLLIEVAESVARSAPNGDLMPRNLYKGPTRGWLGLYPLMADAVRYGRGPHVSRTEKQAINALISALGAGGLVQDWDLDPFRESSHA